MARKGGNLLHIRKHGPFRMQLVEVGGPLDAEGMTTVTFRLLPGEAALLAQQAELYAWYEAELSHAKIVARKVQRRKKKGS